MCTAVIVAGGMGTRMAAAYPGVPKCLVPIDGKPIIVRQIEAFRAACFDDIVVTVGHLGQSIRDTLADGAGLGVTIRYVEEEQPLGTGGALYHLRGMVNEDFLVALGDIVFDVDLQRMALFHCNHLSKVTLAVHPNDHPYDSDVVIAAREGGVTGFLSKKGERPGLYPNLVNSGLYMFSPSVLQGLHTLQKLDLDRDIVVPLIPEGRIKAYRTTEYIKDAGTPERCREVSDAVASGRVAARNLRNRQAAVFLDRDGTLNKHRGLIHRPEDLELEQTAADAVRRLNLSRYLAICITNQSVIARNLCGLDELQDIHSKLDTLLGRKGAYLDDLFFCPHHPDRGYVEERPEYKIHCNCRKPNTGLVSEAAVRYNIDLSRSWFVGDSTADIRTGTSAGARTILVKTGEAGQDGKYSVRPTHRASDLQMAVARILEDEESQ